MIRTNSSIIRIPNSPRLKINTITKIHTHKEQVNNMTLAIQSKTTEATTQTNLYTYQPMMDSWNLTSLSQSSSKKSSSVNITPTPSRVGTQRERLTVWEDSNFSMTSVMSWQLGSQAFIFLLFQRKLFKAKRKQLHFKRDSISLTCSSKNAPHLSTLHSQRNYKLSWDQRVMQRHQ